MTSLWAVGSQARVFMYEDPAGRRWPVAFEDRVDTDSNSAPRNTKLYAFAFGHNMHIKVLAGLLHEPHTSRYGQFKRHKCVTTTQCVVTNQAGRFHKLLQQTVSSCPHEGLSTTIITTCRRARVYRHRLWEGLPFAVFLRPAWDNVKW